MDQLPSRRSMVNTSPDIIILSQDLPSAITKGLIATEASFPMAVPNRGRLSPISRARRVFAVKSLPSDFDARQFVGDLCALVTNPSEVQRAVLSKRVCFALGRDAAYRGETIDAYRTIGKHLLYRLWSEGDILLPAAFKLNGAISRSQLLEMSPEVMRFCLEFPALPERGSLSTRMSAHVPRWLVCTAWHTPEAIELRDAHVLNQFLNAARKGNVAFLNTGLVSGVTYFLHECLQRWPSRISFSENDIARVDNYFKRRLDETIPYDDIEKEIARKDAEVVFRRKMRQTSQGSSKPAIVSRKQLVAEDVTGNINFDVLIYERRYPRDGWFPNCSELTFITRGMSKDGVVVWSSLFNAYLEMRSSRLGYEASKGVRTALNVLADYLAICVPLSCIATGIDGIIPSCPRLFTRYLFITDTGSQSNGSPSFIQYVTIRFSSASAYGVINAARLFFHFIEANYGEESASDIAGTNFKNPILSDFDLPRTAKVGPGGTNKKPLAKHVGPRFVKYMYAIEEFGLHLRRLDVSLYHNQYHLDTESYGYIPFYHSYGTNYPVLQIPLVFYDCSMRRRRLASRFYVCLSSHGKQDGVCRVSSGFAEKRSIA